MVDTLTCLAVMDPVHLVPTVEIYVSQQVHVVGGAQFLCIVASDSVEGETAVYDDGSRFRRWVYEPAHRGFVRAGGSVGLSRVRLVRRIEALHIARNEKGGLGTCVICGAVYGDDVIIQGP